MDKRDVREVYTRNLIDAVIQENKALAQKMIHHGADIIARKSRDVDAIFVALDLNHLDMLEHILKQYTQEINLAEITNYPDFVFENYFSLILKDDNIQALSILDKYGLIDLTFQHMKPDTLCSHMMQECATQCLLYLCDKFSMGEWTHALTTKIRNDLVVSTYQNYLAEPEKHLDFVLSMKKINPELFQLALSNAVFEMKDSLYLARPDKKDELYIITDYMLAGLNPNQEIKDMMLPNVDSSDKKFDDKMEGFIARLKRNAQSVNHLKIDYNFYSLITYDETKIAIEKFMLEKLIPMQEKNQLDNIVKSGTKHCSLKI